MQSVLVSYELVRVMILDGLFSMKKIKRAQNAVKMRSSFQILQKENISKEILPGSEFNGDPVLVVVQHVLCSVSCVS